MKTEADKILELNKMFSRWKEELFPKREYQYRNQCCYAFAHGLAKKAKEAGLVPLKAWCLQSSKREFPKDSPITIHPSDENYAITLIRPTENMTEYQEVGWHNYHVAMCIQSGKETYVFDPIIFDGVATIEQWKNVLNAKDYSVEITGCSVDGKDKSILNGGSGYWRAPDPKDLDKHARNQILQIDCTQPPEHLLRSRVLIEAKKKTMSLNKMQQRQTGRI